MRFSTGRAAKREPTISRAELVAEAESGGLFAIIDACDAPEVPSKMWSLGGLQAVLLYQNLEDEDYWGIGPYLARCDVELLDWITTRLVPDSWGVLAIGDSDLDTVRVHLQQYVVVQDPGGEDALFRFYDPRVLPRFLTSCTLAERVAFYGPLETFVIHDPSASDLLCLPRETTVVAPVRR